MKFLILDIYTNDNWRLVKDTAGGYGTGNDFGNSFFSKLLNKFVAKSISMPSMYSMYIFSILKEKNIKVEYTRKFDLNEIKDSDYIILPTSIICHETELEAIKKLTLLKKKIFVVGVFGNTKKDSYTNSNTFVVPGEPESFFLNTSLNRENLDNFFIKDNHSINISHQLVENLDDLPFPDWKYYSQKYPLKNNFLDFNKKIAVPIVATRGCPYSCFNYCTYPLQQGRKVRFRSVENVVNEIKYWIINLNTNKFIFRDPVFSINRKYTVDLCNKIINENLKISFLIETHLKNLDDELIYLLKKAGLNFVYVGIESINSEVLKDINRFTVDIDQQYKIIKKLVEKKIYVKSMFMFGNPEDNETTIRDTVNYALKLPHQLVQFSIFTPYPGTPIYSLYKDKIIEKNLEKFNQYNLVFNHKNLDNKKIMDLKNFAYKKFYLRLKNVPIFFKYACSLVR